MSGKRRAEKYLTDRNADDDEEEDDELENGQNDGSSSSFKRASEQQLAARPFNGVTTSTPSTTQATSNGSTGPAPFKSFTFNPAPATTPASSTNIGTFGAPSSSSTKDNEDPEVAYYTALRGLNLSIVPPIQRLLEKDPFNDLAFALEQIAKNYREQRDKIEEKRKQSSETSSASSAARALPAPQADAPKSTTTPAPVFSFGKTAAKSTPAASETAATKTNAPPVPAAGDSPAKTPFAGFTFSTTSPAASKPAPAAAPTPPASTSFSFGSTAPSVQTQAVPSTGKATYEIRPQQDFKAAAAASTPSGPAPPAPPSTFTFAGQSFKPDASDSSTSTPATLPAGGFVFNPSKAGTEKSSFTFPATSTSATATGGDKGEKEKSSTIQSQAGASNSSSATPKSSSGPASAATSHFMPVNASRARQPSPLRQVENVQDESSAPSPPPANKPFTGFSFTAPPSSATTVKPSTTNSSTTSTPAFTFGAPSSTFGAPASSTSISVTPSTPAKTAFTFGSVGGSGSSPTSGSSPKASSAFSFGSASGATKTSPQSFNSNVGFSFGSPSSATTTTTTTSSAFGSGGSGGGVPTFGGFGGFGGFSAASTSSNAATGGGLSASSGLSATTGGGLSATPSEQGEDEASTETDGDKTTNPLTGEGAGEENEVTLAEGRVKLYKMEEREGRKEYVEHGVNIVKVKRDGSTGKLRLLGRNDANGRVNVNFSLSSPTSSMNLKVEKAFLSLLGFDKGSPCPMRFRFKNAEGASSFKAALESAVGGH
ncbi:hypothetical protein EMMF5_006063 [Cystobasidiomycetes sp. EMM_F5]